MHCIGSHIFQPQQQRCLAYFHFASNYPSSTALKGKLPQLASSLPTGTIAGRTRPVCVKVASVSWKLNNNK